LKKDFVYFHSTVFQLFLLFRLFLEMTTTMTAKELGRLQRTMNELLQNGKMDEFRKLLKENAELIQTTREKGIVTMVLRFAILNNDDACIASVFDRLSMKRDYFALMVYNPEPEYCAHLFTRYIDAALLDSKDIRFMIENRLTFLFRYLDGKFLHDSSSQSNSQGGGELVESDSGLSTSLSKYTLQECEHYIQKIVAEMEKNLKNKSKSKQYVPVLKKLNELNELNEAQNYDAIIDGANVLLSRNGIPHIDDLNTMLQIVRRNGRNPLVVIHKSHTDKHNPDYYVPGLDEILQKVPHIITPIGLNDDLFILLAYLMRVKKEEQKNGSRISIVTRDTYTDHMDKFKRAEKDVSDDFGKYLASDLVSFVNDGGRITQFHFQHKSSHTISHCIQIIEPYAYIPIEKTHTFRKIQL